MIEIVTSCLLGVLAGAIMSPILHKFIQHKLTKQIKLAKSGFLKVYLPYNMCMTIWDSYIHEGQIAACVHFDNPGSVMHGDIVYFAGNHVRDVEQDDDSREI
mgnify:CR=1 FL=1